MCCKVTWKCRGAEKKCLPQGSELWVLARPGLLPSLGVLEGYNEKLEAGGGGLVRQRGEGLPLGSS